MCWNIYPRGTAVCMSPGFSVTVTVDWDDLRLWRQGEVESGFSGGRGGLTLVTARLFLQPLASLPHLDTLCSVAFFLPQPVW